MPVISYSRRLAELAELAPDAPAVTCAGVTITRAALQSAGNRLARDLAARGVGYGDFVTVALPNSLDWFVAYVAIWKLGAVPQPVSAKLPARELAEIVELAGSTVTLGAEPGRLEGTICLPVGYRAPADLDDGYLYLGDRMQDMILSGGANIYPAEIEAVLQEHPGVRSVCVIGLPDEDRGNVVHAIVEADAASLDPTDVLGFAAERLARYKVPRTVEIVDAPLRDDAGKVRRGQLRAARL